MSEVNPCAYSGVSRKIDVSSQESRGAPPLSTAVGSPLDLVFSFDTTGSMYSCLDEVRKNLEMMISRILKDIPNIRIAVRLTSVQLRLVLNGIIASDPTISCNSVVLQGNSAIFIRY